MGVSFRFGEPRDADTLLPLIKDFYAFERMPYEAARQRRLLLELIAERNLGRLIVFEDSAQVAGYMKQSRPWNSSENPKPRTI